MSVCVCVGGVRVCAWRGHIAVGGVALWVS